MFLIIWSVLQCEFLLGFIALGITGYFISSRTCPPLMFNNSSLSEDRKSWCLVNFNHKLKLKRFFFLFLGNWYFYTTVGYICVVKKKMENPKWMVHGRRNPKKMDSQLQRCYNKMERG